MMMIEAPEICHKCKYNAGWRREGNCIKCAKTKVWYPNGTRPQWCIDADVEVPDADD